MTDIYETAKVLRTIAIVVATLAIVVGFLVWWHK